MDMLIFHFNEFENRFIIGSKCGTLLVVFLLKIVRFGEGHNRSLKKHPHPT